MHPLDGVRAKIERAEEHIKNLDREISAFLSQKPPPYEIVGEHQNEGRDYAYVVKKVPIVPLRFAVMVGDVIHNLRSSLDHTLYALVIKNGGIPTNQTQFPICTTVEKFEQACSRGRIKGVSALAEKIIRLAQPYNSATPDDTFIAALDDLSVLDKHRLPIVIASAATLGHQIVFRNAPNFIGTKANVTVIRMPDYRKQPWAVAKEGEVIFSMGFKEPALHVEPDIEFMVQVAFEKVGRVPLQPVTKILSQICGAIKSGLTAFEIEFN
jgi:hypothetical protein